MLSAIGDSWKKVPRRCGLRGAIIERNWIFASLAIWSKNLNAS